MILTKYLGFSFSFGFSFKIIKLAATRCQILRLKCIKFDFGWGSALDPAGGAYSERELKALPQALDLGAYTSKGGKGEKGGEGCGRMRKG